MQSKTTRAGLTTITTPLAAMVLFVLTLASPLVLAEAVWIDVRTHAEHSADHIKGDLLIPYQNIISAVSALHPDKDTEINLYCRSGRRAGVAQLALLNAGYTAVFNKGSIGNARRVRQQ